jgi:hypothetical protein
MTIEDRLQVVKLAEIDCQSHSLRAGQSWETLKTGFKDAATPWRIVTVGAISGFLMGRSGGNGNASVGAKLFGTLANALITTLGASATAGMAADSAAHAAAEATVDAVSDGVVEPDARLEAASDPRPDLP